VNPTAHTRLYSYFQMHVVSKITLTNFTVGARSVEPEKALRKARLASVIVVGFTGRRIPSCSGLGAAVAVSMAASVSYFAEALDSASVTVFWMSASLATCCTTNCCTMFESVPSVGDSIACGAEMRRKRSRGESGGLVYARRQVVSALHGKSRIVTQDASASAISGGMAEWPGVRVRTLKCQT
jgi:hypothetical protein